jgi:hypothetical protein
MPFGGKVSSVLITTFKWILAIPGTVIVNTNTVIPNGYLHTIDRKANRNPILAKGGQVILSATTIAACRTVRVPHAINIGSTI